MKVKIIKNLGDPQWDGCIGKVYDAIRTKDGNYLIKTPDFYNTNWLKEEVKEEA